MFTSTEKKYLALTLVFLAAGTGIKAYRHAKVLIGPMEDPRILAADSAQAGPAKDSLSGFLSAASASASAGPDSIPKSGLPSEGTRVRESSSDAKPIEPAARTASPHPHAASGRKAAFAGKISLNHAGPAELMEIRGIGEKTAQVIVQYRAEHGPFRELRDLLQVKGIGEKKLEKIVPFLIL